MLRFCNVGTVVDVARWTGALEVGLQRRPKRRDATRATKSDEREEERPEVRDVPPRKYSIWTMRCDEQDRTQAEQMDLPTVDAAGVWVVTGVTSRTACVVGIGLARAIVSLPIPTPGPSETSPAAAAAAAYCLKLE